VLAKAVANTHASDLPNLYEQSKYMYRNAYILRAKRWAFRLKFNKNTTARTLATNIFKTFYYRLIASSVKLKLCYLAVRLVEFFVIFLT